MNRERLAWWAVIIAGVAPGVAVVIVFGVGLRPAPPTEEEVVPPIGALVAIPTAEPAPPNSPCNDALIQGQLVADARFGLAIRTRSGVAATLWPHGYFGRVSADGIQLVAPDGRIIGQTGDRISAGGGAHQIDGVDGVFACSNIEAVPAAR